VTHADVVSTGTPGRLPLHGLTGTEAVEAARRLLPRGAGKARPVYRMAVREGRFDPGATGLGPQAIEAWRAAFDFELAEVARLVEEETPEGATRKAVLRTADGLEHECVSIPMGHDRFTLCVSSQVGCKMGCRFCETGRMGLLRHLTADEIVGQVLVAQHRLGWPIRNVVFMGMGEALDNFEGLAQALRVLTDPGGMAMAQERLTVCTVGHVEGIRRLADLGFKRLNLSVSLNAVRDDLRRDLMPIGRRHPLGELQEALRAYRPRRNFALGVNYCLMPGINDTRDDARGIAGFCRPLERTLVNLIPYNPGTCALTRAPTEDEVVRFVGWLRDEGLAVRRRVTKGRKVMAACGQLGNVALRRSRTRPAAAR
jgi:23S rRNA (adenine2503-C2)-methyltransferase